MVHGRASDCGLETAAPCSSRYGARLVLACIHPEACRPVTVIDYVKNFAERDQYSANAVVFFGEINKHDVERARRDVWNLLLERRRENLEAKQ